MPRISVIIPCYNNKPYLRECLDSVLNQTFSDYEVIVVDDGSTDGTGEIIQSYLPRVRYLRQSNQGPAAARNAGIEAASGEYIAFQDADDLWYPEKLEMQLKFMEANPRFAWAYSDMCTFNEKQILQSSWFSDRPTHQGKVFEQLIYNNFIPTITVMVKKDALLSAGCFDSSFRSCEDKDLWLRMALQYEIGRLSRVLAKRRFHSNNLCRDNRLLIASEVEVMHKLQKKVSDLRLQRIIENKISRLYFELGYFYFAHNELPRAREFFRKSNQRERFDLRTHLYYYSTFLDRRLIDWLRIFKNLGKSAPVN